MSSKIEATVSPYAGLKASCRHIAARTAISDRTHFVVGSAIVGKSNQLQIIEYDDMQATIQCIQTFSHPDEIWWLACNPADPNLVVSISQQSSTRTATATDTAGNSGYQEVTEWTKSRQNGQVPVNVFPVKGEREVAAVDGEDLIEQLAMLEGSKLTQRF
jgi:hypothetical protein